MRSICGTAAAMPKNRPPGTAIRCRTVAIPVNRGEDALERTLAAEAVRSRELAVALIARIAAIRRIADPFIDIDFAATLAASPVASQCGQQAAVAKNAAGLATAAAIRARFARTRAAVVAAPVPHNRLG